MRIISGKYRGRIIQTPKGLPVRPTTDFARTGLFSILRGRYTFEELKCLDLFSGTGSISLEMASEGCTEITAVDENDKCTLHLRKTVNLLEETGIHVIRSEVQFYLKKCLDTFDLIFADPPFDTANKDAIWKIICERNLLKSNGIFILEHQSRESYSEIRGFSEVRKYGNVAFSFFANFGSEIIEP
ncbi:MAG TPA: RsmD family RNA methyltransferase [Bacteroidia bacterium]|nr:RsmD family RNA methyltransferase [Bacteroidia bacterium]